MISVIYKDGNFPVKGTFSFGIAGIYENKEYGMGNIEIEDTIEDFEHECDCDWSEQIQKSLVAAKSDGDTIAKILENYINAQEAKIQKNIKQINDYFLYQLIEHITYIKYPFWEIDMAVLPEYKGKYSEEDFAEVYNEENFKKVNALQNDFYRLPNDGSMEKSDVEKLAKEIFPMFDFDGLIASVHPEEIVFTGSRISVQFSDGWGYSFFSGAYEEFDENLTPTDWHNF